MEHNDTEICSCQHERSRHLNLGERTNGDGNVQASYCVEQFCTCSQFQLFTVVVQSGEERE